MSYEIRNRIVEIPEVDAFLAEYEALCTKHGMAIGLYENCYGDDDVSCGLTLVRETSYLNMEEADRLIPSIAAAHAAIDDYYFKAG